MGRFWGPNPRFWGRERRFGPKMLRWVRRNTRLFGPFLSKRVKVVRKCAVFAGDLLPHFDVARYQKSAACAAGGGAKAGTPIPWRGPLDDGVIGRITGERCHQVIGHVERSRTGGRGWRERRCRQSEIHDPNPQPPHVLRAGRRTRAVLHATPRKAAWVQASSYGWAARCIGRYTAREFIPLAQPSPARGEGGCPLTPALSREGRGRILIPSPLTGEGQGEGERRPPYLAASSTMAISSSVRP